MRLFLGGLKYSCIRTSCIICLLFIITCNYASNQSKIKNISAKIEQLRHSLLKKQSKKNDVITELSSIEKQINLINIRIRVIDKKIRLQNRSLKPLLIKQKKLQKTLIKQQNELAKQLRSAYQMGQYSSLQLFLSQQQPSDITRIGTYYKIVNQTRENIINDFVANVAAIKANQAIISKTLTSLRKLKENRLNEQKTLKQKEYNRNVLLNSLDKQIRSSQQRIALLKANKKRLQGVINNLSAEKTYASIQGKTFGRLRHQLSWPVKGRITRNYGQLYDGRLRSNGIFISAPIGNSVRAVASGQVIYAHWLRGYGNMIIITHRGNYMTLYAHNNAVLVEVGEKIKPGEQIGIVGNSGGLTQSGLYFEVRYKGKARDPRAWFR